MSKKSLLQQALERHKKVKNSISKRSGDSRNAFDNDEVMELALGYLRGDFSISSVAFALGRSPHLPITVGLKRAMDKGLINIVKSSKPATKKSKKAAPKKRKSSPKPAAKKAAAKGAS